MRITVHLERSEDGIVWWAESPTEPTFSAAAPTLAELKVLILEAIEMEGWTPPEYLLATNVPRFGSAVPAKAADGDPVAPVLKTLVTAAG